MKRLQLFGALIAAIFISSRMVPQGSGVTVTCVNELCRVAASSSSLGLILGPFLFCVFHILPRKPVEADTELSVGLLRRLMALYLDIFLVLLLVSSMMAMPMLWMEASYTGAFQWSFLRETLRDTDFLISSISVGAGFVSIILYQYICLAIGSPTAGQYMMGYRIASISTDWDFTRLIRRFCWAVLTLSVWPVAVVYALQRKDKAMWFDLKSDSLPERTCYKDAKRTVSGLSPTNLTGDSLYYGPPKRR